MAGVGSKRARLLAEELHLRTWRDLLYYFPYKHIDRTRLYKTDELFDNMPYVQLKGRIVCFKTEGEGRKQRLKAIFADDVGSVELIWFQGIKYIPKLYQLHKEYVLFGHPNSFNGRINITHPDLDPVETMSLAGMAFQPYYHTSDKMKRAGMDSRAIERLTSRLIQTVGERVLTVGAEDVVAETLPEWLRVRYGLMPLWEALKSVHYPACSEDLDRGTYRIKFEELFYTQLQILEFSRERSKRAGGTVFARVGSSFHQFYSECLPFGLTGAQKRVIREMHADLQSGRQMNRLLQGDVGSGKTIVALMLMLLAIDNGYQACIMAPTEILAEQHAKTFAELLAPTGVKTALLTGKVKGKRRREVLEGLACGEVDILIGTHAVIEDEVAFCRLGLIVIDEQHRFGVAQRARLWSKGGPAPHVLVMTATPIPRTLAMTLYGDLDVSVLDELPPGRKPIRTIHIFDERRDEINQLIMHEVMRGQQAYIVYPLIKESEKVDLKNLEDGYEKVCRDFPSLRVSKIHGKMRAQEKEEEMQRFACGETQILVATTVIEVGVNVPKASVMVIENAERFGLAQLHQMRGRVGRGADQSYCILVTKCALGSETRRRMQIMTETTDGFVIAEEDLKMRGPGEIDGTMQSGTPFELKLADLARDGAILQRARDAAAGVLQGDSAQDRPENAVLWRTLRGMKNQLRNWSEIS